MALPRFLLHRNLFVLVGLNPFTLHPPSGIISYPCCVFACCLCMLPLHAAKSQTYAASRLQTALGPQRPPIPNESVISRARTVHEDGALHM